MNARDSRDSEMERALEAHFASVRGDAPPTPDLWAYLQGRLGAQSPRPLWGRIRDWAIPEAGSFRVPAFAATAAVVLVAAVAGSVWLTVGRDGGIVPAQYEVVERIVEVPVVEERIVEVEVERIVEAATEQVVEVEVEKILIATPTPGVAMSSVEEIAGDAELLPDLPDATTFEDNERQAMTDAAEDGVSTFSLDTDRTSFQLALNWAMSGYPVDPDSVRAEEWVNAFDYGYAAPSVRDRFAITSDLLEHPLGGGRYMVRVAFKAPEVVSDAPLNVTLVLDASGSMADGNRVDIARAAAEAIRRSLDGDDLISVVHFTADVIGGLTVEGAFPDDPAVAQSIGRLAPHQSTNVQAGLDLGVRLADRMRRERPEAINYIILMSDGVANVDATDPFAILEATSAPAGSNPLRLITVGVGIENYNDHLLEQLAQHGDGWYRYLFDAEQARSVFRRDNWLALASPVADQTRAQVVWNPEAVRSWRIVGYENRVTSAESFTQDRQEFAEVYSGAATTVFYELELHEDFRHKGGLGQVELRWVEPETGRAWSQGGELVSGGRVTRLGDDPLLEFGAVVALTADRYSAIGDPAEPGRQHARDLWSLRDRALALQGDLGHLAAFNDFVYVLEALVMNVPGVSPDDSGYSR